MTSSAFSWSLPAFNNPTFLIETSTSYVKEESELCGICGEPEDNTDNLPDGSYTIKIFSGPNFIGGDNVVTDTNKWPGYIYDSSTDSIRSR